MGPKKESPKKESPKAKKESPKKDKGSPDKKNSPKKGKKEADEAPPPEKSVLKKITFTFPDLAPYVFNQFRCTSCVIVFHTFQQFINHSCWRKFYSGQFHLGETQTYCCRSCDRLYNSEADYASHTCVYVHPEEVLPLTYRHHFKFFLNWERRTKRENENHEPDWRHLGKCIKCGNRFKSEIAYLLHSCAQYSLLKPEVVKALCICSVCKYIMQDNEQFEAHLRYCNPEKAYLINFETSLFNRACHQFVLGRHCYEFDLNKRNVQEIDKKRLSKIPVGCFACGIVQENILEYLYHPCVAGKLITPMDIELCVFCNDCRCLFVKIECCETHMKSCPASQFTFIRLSLEEVKVALERWTLDIFENTHLPERPKQLMCDHCFEIFRYLHELLLHLCPRRPKCIRYFMQPISLQELYCCQTCFTVLFSAAEAVKHTDTCRLKPRTLLIQLHPTLKEILLCLELWTNLPKLLQLEMTIGIPAVDEVNSSA